MGKVVKIAAIVAGLAVAFVPGVGPALTGAIFGALTGAAGATIGTFAATALAIGQGVTLALALTGISGAIGFGGKLLGLGPKPPKASAATLDRLRASLDPRAFRKIVFGNTAGATDVHYQEFTGADQEYLDSIVTVASHAVHSIDEIWFDEKKAWDAVGGVTSDFAGYLTVTVRTEGTTANAFTIAGSSSWTAAQSRMVGLAYVHLRYKLTGNNKKSESPFGTSVTSRITVRVHAAKVYDPRLDSTVGGSGSHRADDQSTWAWVDDDTGRNPALQLLWYLLGWRIQNPVDSTWALAVGLGIPSARLDMASFIAAANLCDEPVTLLAGGTQPRYRSDGLFSEGDDPLSVIENFKAAMNGMMRDVGGQLVLEVLHNDLGTAIDLDAGDVIGEFTWMQTPPLDQTYNVVRGRYVDASNAGLYQLADYPEVWISSPDGIERPTTFEMPMVQSAVQAQRIAKTYLQRSQYPGTFSATFLASGWRCQVGKVVRLTFPALGFSNKLFRVTEHTIRADGTCPMTLREEHASIYAWDAEEGASVGAATPISYNPLNEPWVQAIDTLGPTIRNAAIKNPRDVSDVPCALLTGTTTDPGGVSTIAIARHDWDYPYSTLDVTREPGTITGLDPATTYYVYFDDATLANLTPTYAATEIEADGLNSTVNPSRHPLGIITTPAIGAGPTYGTGYPGYGYGPAVLLPSDFNSFNNRNGAAIPTPTMPTGGAAINHSINANGSANVRVDWGFGGDPNSIDGYEVLLFADDNNAVHTPGSLPGYERVDIVPAGITDFVWFGLLPTDWYTIAVRAYRDVDSDIAVGGKIYSSWKKSSVSSENPYRPDTEVAIDSAVLIDGVSAGTVASAVGNFNTRNDRLATTPPTATTATDGSCIDHTLPGNGTASISFEWAWSGNDEDIDYWEVMVYSSTSSSAYTPGTSPLLEQRSTYLPSTRAIIINGRHPTLWFTFACRPVRVVDPDVNAAGVIYGAWKKSTYSGENPYRPSTSAVFAGDISGTINGTSAANVATWSSYAQLAINPDGTIKDDLVGEGAIIPGTINLAGYVRQGSTYNLTVDGEIVGASALTGGAIEIATFGVITLNISAVFPYEITVVDPVQGTEYYMDLQLEIFKDTGSGFSSAASTDNIRVSDIWHGPSVSGYQTLGRKIWRHDYQYSIYSTPADWALGWRAQAGPDNRGNLFQRYIKIDNVRSQQ